MLENSFKTVSRRTALLLFGLLALPAWAGAPMAKTNAPAFHRFMFGAYEITVLSDGTIDLPVDQLLKEPPQQTQDALRKSFLKTPLETSVNAFLINTGERLVLVDAGAGTLFGPTLGKLADNLRASGYKPENVDDVLLTHMHPDHVGGPGRQWRRAIPQCHHTCNRKRGRFLAEPEKPRRRSGGVQELFPGCHGFSQSLRSEQKAGAIRGEC
jgi:glyoxylase-like metal-dependent hydrolase (beta-lactamase superfamily II)